MGVGGVLKVCGYSRLFSILRKNKRHENIRMFLGTPTLSVHLTQILFETWTIQKTTHVNTGTLGRYRELNGADVHVERKSTEKHATYTSRRQDGT